MGAYEFDVIDLGRCAAVSEGPGCPDSGLAMSSTRTFVPPFSHMHVSFLVIRPSEHFQPEVASPQALWARHPVLGLLCLAFCRYAAERELGLEGMLAYLLPYPCHHRLRHART